ncbi:thiolase family protein [Actinomadura sp. SCN-SB]|uniref:thiolase family protein n=1 Tax=Actinomadura sp. SCN-SB TaxID=3373092 RepID=UPI0037512891
MVAAVRTGDAMSVLDGRAVISGAGQSQIGRRLERDGLELTLEACLRALDHAGLTAAGIDGVATYPGAFAPDPGFTGAGAYDVIGALGIRARWFLGAMETAGQLGPLADACMAVATGMADHVLFFRSVWESTAQAGRGRGSVLAGGEQGRHRAEGFHQWLAPYGAISAANWIALAAQRYVHEYGLTREQLAQVPLNARRNAALNPSAIYRAPLTLDDYLAARIISTPFCLYDCDVPCDGATAIVISRREATTGLRQDPLTVRSLGTGMYERNTWDQRPDLTTMAAHDAAHTLWERTHLRPADVDIAQLYDGFSYLTLQWLEALGFCERGEAGRFVQDGERISRTGELPLNTSGGQLSGGRLHGVGFLHEACLQLWGQAGDRQVPGSPAIAAVAAGGGPVAGCLLLSRDG